MLTNTKGGKLTTNALCQSPRMKRPGMGNSYSYSSKSGQMKLCIFSVHLECRDYSTTFHFIQYRFLIPFRRMQKSFAYFGLVIVLKSVLKYSDIFVSEPEGSRVKGPSLCFASYFEHMHVVEANVCQ